MHEESVSEALAAAEEETRAAEEECAEAELSDQLASLIRDVHGSE